MVKRKQAIHSRSFFMIGDGDGENELVYPKIRTNDHDRDAIDSSREGRSSYRQSSFLLTPPFSRWQHLSTSQTFSSEKSLK